MFFLNDWKHWLVFSSKLKYALLSSNLMFIKPSYGMVVSFNKCQKSKLPFRFFYMFYFCLPSHSCNYRPWKPAIPNKYIYIWCVYKHENWKNNTKTYRFVLLTHRPCMWPAFATHLKGSQVRTHAGPDLSEASRKKKLRVARKRG